VATFGDLKTYVEQDGWTQEKNLARRRSKTGDHWRYSKEQPGGPTLRTKVSHSVREGIGASLFAHILRDQLRVDEDTFWAVVHGRTAPETSAPPAPTPVPGWLIQRLIATVGMSEDEVRALTAEEAAAAWEAYQTRER
jgi:hypothetical protein